jgi:hypothetical protein
VILEGFVPVLMMSQTTLAAARHPIFQKDFFAFTCFFKASPLLQLKDTECWKIKVCLSLSSQEVAYVQDVFYGKTLFLRV